MSETATARTPAGRTATGADPDATADLTAPARTAAGPSATPAVRRRLPVRARHALLTAHIALSVALLGDSAGYLAVAIRTSRLDDPAEVHESVEILNMFSLVFGIPLSLGALLTGVGLGLGTRWGVFRHPWVVAKLALIVSVLLVGACVISPASDQMLDGEGDATGRLIAASAYDVVALAVAVGLSVFKPGRPFRRAARRDRRAAPTAG